MSIVNEYTSADATEALRRQRVSSTIASLVVSLLVVVLIGLILGLILIPGWFVESKTIVTYTSGLDENSQNVRPELQQQIQRKPSAPSSSVARVIASASVSNLSIPVPEVMVAEPSADFGSGNDFGEGWGSGNGAGEGGGGTTFFGQASKGDRICYVIDYSMSMSADGREGLMRKELSKSLSDLSLGAKYQMIFFAGPAWVAGSKVEEPGAKKLSIIKGEDGTDYKWVGSSAHNWKPKGKRQKAGWLTAERSNIVDSKSLVRKTKLVWGTQWRDALEMALEMSPPPQVIYFMTDGSAGSASGQTARTIAAKAKKLGVTVNCVAMMEPKAFDAMDDLAKRTGGHFTKVMKRGKVEKVR